MTLRVAVGSTNPVKRLASLEAVRAALRPEDVTAIPVAVPSDVPDQPVGDDETLRGARARAEEARRAEPDAQVWIGLEGGVVARDGALECMAWAVVLGVVDTESSEGTDDSADAYGDGHAAGRGCTAGVRRGESRTASFTLPEEIARLVRDGVELGTATDLVVGETGTKSRSGTVGPLTDGVVDRVAFYAHALVLAMVPLRNTAFSFSAATEAEDSGPA